MDIYSANNAIKRVLSFVEAYSESNSVMYEKSKVRYQELLDNCERAAQLLSICLSNPHKRGEISECDTTAIDVQPECIDADLVNSNSGHFDEFEAEPHAKVNHSCERLESVQGSQDDSSVDPTNNPEVDEIVCVDPPAETSSTSTNSKNTHEAVHVSAPDTSTQSTQSAESSETETSESPPKKRRNNKGIIHRYGTMFRKLKKVHTEYQDVNDCISLLSDWFEVRFSGKDPDFRYNPRMIHKWVEDIVIVYGNHIYDHTQGVLYQDMRSWIDSLRMNPESSKYAIPYEIYYGSQRYSETGISMTAVMLWDMLYDAGLKNVCEPNDPAYPSSDCIYRLCDAMSPDYLEYYGNYQHDDVALLRSRIA